MIDEEIYYLTKHGNFQADYIENIPVYKRRHYIFLLNKEIEKENEEIERIRNKHR